MNKQKITLKEAIIDFYRNKFKNSSVGCSSSFPTDENCLINAFSELKPIITEIKQKEEDEKIEAIITKVLIDYNLIERDDANL